LALVAFGKHPAWDDHMDDIGLDTDFLVSAKRYLYIRGIRENIETGAWTALEENDSAIPFGHRFVWSQERQILAGRLWSSRDGRGRQNYPMVLGAYFQTGLPTGLGLQILQAVDTLETPCMRLADTEDLHVYIREQQERLRQTLVSACAHIDRPKQDTVLADLARSLDTPILLRILYHISRQADVPLESKGVRPGRSIMVRIPLGITENPSYPYWWFDLFKSWFSADTLISLFKPDHAAWMDAFIGEPQASHVFALRARTEAVPLTSTIPYNIPSEFAAAFRKMAGL
jgi:hypothetical protein